MKRLLLLPFIILFTFTNAQEYWMENGTVTTCSGMFYDSGGPDNPFSNNEHLIFTICPDRSDVADNATILTFADILFMTRTGADYMNIYDGDDTNAPLIGTYIGGMRPGGDEGIRASDLAINPSGCLTVEFISDPSGPGPGWTAEISCAVPCQSITPTITTTPARDPDGTLTVLEGDTVAFTGSATFSQTDVGATYTWDFGDGSTATGLNATHTYPDAGTYSVSLTVMDGSGNPDCAKTLTFLLLVTYDNNVPCPSVHGVDFIENSSDVLVNCNYPLDNGLMRLRADYAPMKETSSYVVQSIPFQPPYPVTSGAGVNITLDDAWANPTSFPAATADTPGFNFCYFGTVQSGLQVGANGRINFDRNRPTGGGSDQWSFSSTLPITPASPNQHMLNTINGAYHDINIANASNANFSYGFQGSYPCRMFVVNYNNIPLFSCTSQRTTQQIVLWEGSNYIDVYLHNKPACPGWNSGNSLVGLQGPNYGQYAVAPGRNTSSWSAQNEAWRFIPDGPEMAVQIEWFDEDGNLVGSTRNLDIYPTEDTFYTVVVTYEICGQEPVVVTDTVTITFDYDSPEVEDLMIEVCDIDGSAQKNWDLTSYTNLVTQGQPDWVIEGYYTNRRSANQAVQNDQIVDPAAFFSGSRTVYVRVEDTRNGCYTVFNIELDFFPDLEPEDLTATSCIPPDAVEVVFNLNSFNDHFLAGQFYDIHYYENQADAEAGNESEALAGTDLTEYTITQTTIIWVRVTTEEGCYGVAELTLEVNDGPDSYVFDEPVVFCDNAPLGSEIVDLTGSEDDILGGVTGITFIYYETYLDASEGNTDNAIVDPTQYTLTPDTTEIYIVIMDANGCFKVITMPVILLEGVDLTPAEITMCDIGNDGTEDFDLTSVNEDIIDNPEDYTFHYYPTEADCNAGTNEIADITAYPSGNAIICVVVISADGCKANTTIELILSATPDINPADLSVCMNADGELIFNLTDAEADILDGQVDLTISYYNTETDATQNNTENAIADPTIYTGTDGEIIYVRLENENECFSVVELTLHQSPQPTADAPPIIQVCDLTGTGSQEVDLTQHESIIIGGQTDVTVTYYLTEDDANNAENSITNPAAYDAEQGTTTIYVRVENEFGCFAITQFDVVVQDSLTLATASIEQCDADGDGLAIWDLTSENDTIIADSQNFTFQYYTSQADLDGGTGEIMSPTDYESGATTIFVLVTNDQGCYASTTLELILTDGPIATPASLAVCAEADGSYLFNLTDAETDLLAGQTNITLNYFTSLIDAQNGDTTNAVADPTQYISATDGEIIYVRLEDNSGCVSIAELTLNHNEQPDAFDSGPIQVCDLDDDGSEMVDLTQNEAIITGGATGVIVTYYTSQADAESGTGEIDNPTNYQVNSGTTTIYVRVESAEGCFAFNSFDVIVDTGLTLNTATLELCDIGDDGTETWDLTEANDDIISGTGYTFQYYPSQADLDNDDNEITTPTAYESGSTTIYVLVTNEQGCFASTTLELILTDGPTVTPASLAVCMDADGNYIFNLTDAENDLLNGQRNITLTYYTSLVAAENADTTNTITNLTQYTSTTDGEIIYVRLEDGSGCFSVAELTLNHNPQPEAFASGPIQVCDVDDSGSENIDLTQNEAIITGAATGVTVTYYTSQADAESGSNPINNATSYQVNTGTTTIYVRVENSDGCFAINSFEVIVDTGLTLFNASIELCDIGSDGTENFDLTSMNDVISGGTTGFNFAYYTSLTNATNNTSPITGDLTQYASNGQIIYVLVSSGSGDDCSSIAELELILKDLPQVNTNLEWQVCDPDFDGVFGFNLNDLNDIVVNSTTGVSISYYSSLADAESQTNPMTQAAANNITTVPMQIYVRVEETGNAPNCVNYTMVTLVEGAQTHVNVNIPPLEACDNGFGTATFDLSDMADIVTNESTTHWVSYHTTLANAENDVNPINPNQAELGNGTIYVRVKAEGKCPSITQFEVIINPLPLAEILAPTLAFCSTDSLIISAKNYSSDLNYEWKDGTGNVLGNSETLELIGDQGDQSITLVVTDPDTNCSNETTVDFDSIAVPVITSLNTTNNSITISATGDGPFEYSINGVDWQQSPVFENLMPGMYDVMIRSVNAGCVGIGMSTLVMNVSNIITPNNDGLNDYFVIPYMDAFKDEAGNVQESRFSIYNRYGKLLHSDVSSNEKTSFIWDGSSHGRILPSGDYWYMLELADGRKTFGHITVKNR